MNNRPPTALAAWLALQLLFLPGCGDPASARSGVPGSTPPNEIFEEIAVESGIDFLHDSGAKGEYFMPEQAGSGAAFLDFNNDGLLDIYLVHCGGPESNSRNQLYQQEAGGRFKNVSQDSGLDVTGYGMAAITGDVNNDGWVDLVLTEYGRTRLFLNASGRFKEVTDSSGIDNPRWGTAASFLDFDRDGWLDLIVANYLDYDPNKECVDSAGAPEYCGPHSFPGTVARLFRNVGASGKGVRFEDVTVASGIARVVGPALGVLCADFTGDRWPDIFLADDGQPNRLFVNQRNGRFTEEAALRGLAYTGMGSTAANMGVAVGDVNGDGLFDLFVTHLATEQHTLWTQNPRGAFLDQTAPLGLVNPKWKGTGFGALFADLNHDGALDLAFVNGAVRRANFPGPRLERLPPFWSPYAQRNQIFLGSHERRFTDASEQNATFCGRAGMGRGLAMADYDRDGDLDLLVTNTGGPAQLFRNRGANAGHWLQVRAVEPKLGGRDALGAEVLVEAAGRLAWRLVQSSFSYLSASCPVVHFGLGDATRYERIRVIWPDGQEEEFPGGTANRKIVLERGTGTLK